MKNEKKFFYFLILVFAVLFMLDFVISYYFHTSGTSSYLSEDNGIFSYNFSSNVTNESGDITPTYSFENISSSLYPNQFNSSFYYWFSLNSSTGVMNINSTNDNQTGNYTVAMKVKNQNGEGTIRNFYFIINATNDAPIFTNINNQYNVTYGSIFTYYLNASDEDEHYPLMFNVTFTNCTLANWSTRGNNCTLFYPVFISNKSSVMNFSSTRNDVGVYYLNISVRDSAGNYSNCTSGFCSSNYFSNKTSYYSQLVTIEVYAYLEINASDCMNKVFYENSSNTCLINISTKGNNDTLNITSIASLANYQASVANSSWFFAFNQTISQNNIKTVIINVTPQKTEIGNWSINFSVIDINYNSSSSVTIPLYVNRTYNSLPFLSSINSATTSINLLTRINLSSYDNDFLIPDKNENGGGYNESVNFSVKVYNRSQLSQQLFSINDFSVQILNMPVSGTNRTDAKIEFTPNTTSFGNYTINITINDKNSRIDYKMFNLSILNNNAPLWRLPLSTNIDIFENNQTYFNLSMNVSDPENDSLTFSYNNDTNFPSFNLNSTTGQINFTPVDEDIGQHLVTINISDGYLVNASVFNFTIYNIQDLPSIERPLTLTNGSRDSNSNMNLSEDNYTSIDLWIQDDDFRIPTSQKSYYNENINVNITITGVNSSLFNFTKNNAFPTQSGMNANRSKFEAIFIPKKGDVGSYNITINISDNNGSYSYINFNLTVFAVSHAPVLINLSNYTSAVNRSLYIRLNATDIEDGNSSNSNNNFTFRYNFINGSDFINNNQSIYNFSTGELNITFNSSQGGLYRLNITVNDSSGMIDYDSFFIYVYDIPVIISPNINYTFNAVENITTNLTFNVNHSMQNNLSYSVYIQNRSIASIVENYSYYGNSTNLTISFTPDFRNESSSILNLTLFVYPSDSLLLNRTNVNLTFNWNMTINHSNSPLSFSGAIGGALKRVTGGSPQIISLSDYFMDYDALSSSNNQSIGFIYNSIILNGSNFSSNITVSIKNWTNGSLPNITFSSTIDAFFNYSITGFEFNETNLSHILRNVTSNNFSVELTVNTTPVVVSVPSAGGGGGGGSSGTNPVALKIITPGPVSAFNKQRIKVPLVLHNSGTRDLNRITLKTIGLKNGSQINYVNITLDRNFFTVLEAGKRTNVTMYVYFDTNQLSGDYEILVNASVEDPHYSDWAKIYINLQKVNETNAKKYILFTEEFLVQNPNCMELTEILNEAKKSYEQGNYGDARAKAEYVVNSCKDYISQVSLPEEKLLDKLSVNEYIIITTLGSFILGIIYYGIKRRRFQKNR